MKNTYFTWDDFVNNFGSQMVSSEDIYNNMSKGGLKENALLIFDFHFLSDKKENLEGLSLFLHKHYPYTLEDIILRDDKLWELSGKTNKIPVTNDNLMYWVLDMYKRGYEFDSELDGYGAPYNPDKLIFPDYSKDNEDYYFDLALERYNAGDLSGAIINWTNVLVINVNEVNSYYSRAIVKSELYAWKAALRDYDKAIELAPDFISALLNRGGLKDDNGDHKGAIKDYMVVLKSKHSDNEDRKKAYYNSGNSYFNLKNMTEACKHWKKAHESGADYASEVLEKHCYKR